MTMPWDDGREQSEDAELSIRRVAVAPEPDGSYQLMLQTSRGDLYGMLHVCEGGTGAAVLLSGASGGFDGPAVGLYARLAPELVAAGVTVLRLTYRMCESTLGHSLPEELNERIFTECLLDALAGLSFLKGVGAERVVLVGHSAGGGIAIRAAGLSPLVSAVASLASQRRGTEEVSDLAPRPLLLVHGMYDQQMPATVSDDIYQRALEPKRLVLYAEAGHTLVQCKDELFELLREWIPQYALTADG